MKQKPRLAEKMWAKTAAFILVVIFFIGCVGSCMSVAIGWNIGAYSSSKDSLTAERLMTRAHSDSEMFLYDYLSGAYYSDIFVSDSFSCDFYNEQSDLLFQAVPSDSALSADCWEFEFHFTVYRDSFGNLTIEDRERIDNISEYGDRAIQGYDVAEYTAKAHVLKAPVFGDRYYGEVLMLNIIYSVIRFGIPLAAVCAVLTIVLFVFLMCSAGHRAGCDGIFAGPATKIPFDIVVVFTLLVECLFINFIVNAGYNDLVFEICIILVSAAAGISLFVAFCIDLAARVKLGGLFRHTVIYYFLRFICRLCRKAVHGVGTCFHNLPLIWKSIVFLAVLAIWGFILLVCYPDDGLFIYVLGGTAFSVLTLWSSMAMVRLRETAKRLSNGDLDAKVDESKLFLGFKDHGADLNNIGNGISKAVDERMKSEHLKTELITNVSHDIKTPLTSIINYTDLISREPPGSEKIAEYTEVLQRQGVRLKKLIEDLVEASKASTGNIDVNLDPCDASVMLSQVTGEYAERFKASRLTLINTKPENPVMIEADGRLLWRVFDNLLNNICKYAQPDTRVYASLDTVGSRAVICLKNISRYALNIDASELMERFVRGDSSRHTDGSGLGLSIAKSLTELQGGTMELAVDGDLFKATLFFNLIS